MLLIFSSLIFARANKDTVTFKSLDNLEITADLYMTGEKNRPLILLFHQANSSRGEYPEIANRLNQLGFDCMAVDLRSGKISNGIKNRTHLEAIKHSKDTSYLSSRIDIIASFNYARQYSDNLIAWGSSYSASLVLKTIGEKPRYAKAILAFSPGEYFEKFGKPNNYISSSARKLKIPVFITSARDEKNSWIKIYNAIDSPYRKSFLPSSSGHHGSSALWSKYSDNSEYWRATEKFLFDLNF